jgi:hypothetical protein
VTKWIFITAGAVVLLSLFLTVRYGIGPRPIPLIKPTAVESIESAGVLVYRRMRQDVRSQQFILAGGLPLFAHFERFWQGFFLGAQNDGAPFAKIVTTKGMPLFQEASVVKNEVVENPKANSTEKDRVLYYLPSTETSHLNANSFSKRLDEQRQSKVSITLHPFLITKQQNLNLGISCDEPDASFLRQLDCLAVRVSQQTYRKKLDPQKNYVALYRFGRSDYIAFWYEGSNH